MGLSHRYAAAYGTCLGKQGNHNHLHMHAGSTCYRRGKETSDRFEQSATFNRKHGHHEPQEVPTAPGPCWRQIQLYVWPHNIPFDKLHWTCCTELEVRNDGKTIFQVPQPNPPQLLGLTGEILHQVIGYIVAKQKAVYDLVNGTTSGLYNSLSRVNSRMRRLYHHELERHGDNTIVLRSTSTITSSAIFEPLWKRVRSVGRHSWATCDPISIAKTSFNLPKIILDLQCVDYAATSSIPLDSWEICRAICHFKSSTPIIFRLTGFDHGSHVDHHTTVGHIRHRTFGLLVSLSRSLSTEARNTGYVAVEVCGPGTSFEAITMEYHGDSPKKFVPNYDIAHEFESKHV